MAKDKVKEALYKAEGLRRSKERKQKRYETFTNKNNGSCKHCSSGWHSCPFQEDMNSNYDEHYCTCCSSCRNDCAMEI